MGALLLMLSAVGPVLLFSTGHYWAAVLAIMIYLVSLASYLLMLTAARDNARFRVYSQALREPPCHVVSSAGLKAMRYLSRNSSRTLASIDGFEVRAREEDRLESDPSFLRLRHFLNQQPQPIGLYATPEVQNLLDGICLTIGRSDIEQVPNRLAFVNAVASLLGIAFSALGVASWLW